MKIILLPLCWALVEAGWKPDPPVDTNVETFESHPIVLNARKLAKLVPHQDVVATCRYVMFKTPQTFHKAEESCENLDWPIQHKGISLATIQNEDENEDIRTLIRLGFGMHFDKKNPFAHGNWVFIGLSKRINNVRALTENEKGVFNADEWFYQDNQKAKYSNFHREMPDQQSKGNRRNKEYQNWVQVNKKGYWDDTYSSKSLPYICQYCGKYIVLSKQVRWDKAKEYCESAGLVFATVNSKEENAELLYAANIALGSELFPTRFNNSNWVWIGEKENNVTGTWEHHDGTPLNYNPDWDFKTQPDNFILPRVSKMWCNFHAKMGNGMTVSYSGKDHLPACAQEIPVGKIDFSALNDSFFFRIRTIDLQF